MASQFSQSIFDLLGVKNEVWTPYTPPLLDITPIDGTAGNDEPRTGSFAKVCASANAAFLGIGWLPLWGDSDFGNWRSKHTCRKSPKRGFVSPQSPDLDFPGAEASGKSFVLQAGIAQSVERIEVE